ncbi:hypothetical protein SDC9_120612 [bioreactor metagenome]|uniref:Uncharacterized protein n=1 Tax=bioreactor metagenome TaxID=1076179 RepID=A0A645C7B6_9ZZZZ
MPRRQYRIYPHATEIHPLFPCVKLIGNGIDSEILRGCADPRKAVYIVAFRVFIGLDHERISTGVSDHLVILHDCTIVVTVSMAKQYVFYCAGIEA